MPAAPAPSSILYDLSWVEPLRAPWLTPLFEALSWLGYAPFFLLFLPLGYWLWDREAFTRLALVVLFAVIANAWFKELFQDPRPDLAWALDGRVGESLGRPSGHAQVAVVGVWGLFLLLALLGAAGAASRLGAPLVGAAAGFGLGLYVTLLVPSALHRLAHR